ncbi:MAG: hypothetical protein WBD32_05075 [Acidobacteriaceae bacterium]
MFELTMASALGDLVPAILFDQTDYVPAFHGRFQPNQQKDLPG